MTRKSFPTSTLAELVGQCLGKSRWINIDQSQINEFGNLTGDVQFIHVDPAAAKDGPFGSTIAHGFLTLSLLSSMAFEALPDIEGSSAKINYGFDKVRFLTPVRCDANVRGLFTLKSIVERQPGQWLMAVDVVVELKGEPRPAIIAEWIILTICAT